MEKIHVFFSVLHMYKTLVSVSERTANTEQYQLSPAVFNTKENSAVH